MSNLKQIISKIKSIVCTWEIEKMVLKMQKSYMKISKNKKYINYKLFEK
jgi:hypothetical protein